LEVPARGMKSCLSLEVVDETLNEIKQKVGSFLLHKSKIYKTWQGEKKCAILKYSFFDF
jgi:hypothetical protein